MSREKTTSFFSAATPEHNAKLDLDAYLQRIGYDENPSANLKTLQAIQQLHTQAIPFENFNPLLGLPVHLDLSALQQKMVFKRRGGYCFEHNLLLYHVLNSIGFEATGLAGRVILNKPDSAITSR